MVEAKGLNNIGGRIGVPKGVLRLGVRLIGGNNRNRCILASNDVDVGGIGGVDNAARTRWVLSHLWVQAVAGETRIGGRRDHLGCCSTKGCTPVGRINALTGRIEGQAERTRRRIHIHHKPADQIARAGESGQDPVAILQVMAAQGVGINDTTSCSKTRWRDGANLVEHVNCACRSLGDAVLVDIDDTVRPKGQRRIEHTNGIGDDGGTFSNATDRIGLSGGRRLGIHIQGGILGRHKRGLINCYSGIKRSHDNKRRVDRFFRCTY